MHVAGGTAGLISGSIAAWVKKGSKPHLWSGKIFVIGMLIASVAALVISWLPDHHSLFLFAVGGFTLYMTVTGNRIIQLKRQLKSNGSPFSWVDQMITFLGGSFGIFLLVLSVQSVMNKNIFGIVPGIFGLICLNYARLDFALFTGKKQIKTAWMENHIIRMMGAMIASYTAFLVVNIHIQFQWILWILPTFIGSIFIARFLKKYTSQTKK
jgi:hypothetical protein